MVLKTANGYIIYATYLTEKQGMAISTDGLTWLVIGFLIVGGVGFYVGRTTAPK